jgi:hypothetical protein
MAAARKRQVGKSRRRQDLPGRCLVGARASSTVAVPRGRLRAPPPGLVGARASSVLRRLRRKHGAGRQRSAGRRCGDTRRRRCRWSLFPGPLFDSPVLPQQYLAPPPPPPYVSQPPSSHRRASLLLPTWRSGGTVLPNSLDMRVCDERLEILRGSNVCGAHKNTYKWLHCGQKFE